jgi:hypothetical protein
MHLREKLKILPVFSLQEDHLLSLPNFYSGEKGQRHSLSGYSLASQSSGPGSRPGLFKWYLWWTK